MSENSHLRASARGRRHSLGTWGGWLTRPEIIGVVCAVITVLLGALALHNKLVTIVAGVVAGGGVLVALAVFIFDQDRHRQRKLDGLARQLAARVPPYLVTLPPDVKDRTPLIDDLEKRLREDERLCVVRIHGEGTLDQQPGIAEDAIPLSVQCRSIVCAIGWQLEEASGLREAERLGKHLRALARRSRLKGVPIDALRRDVVETLEGWDKAADRLVPLADARLEDLKRPAGEWLLDLFKDLRRRFGVSYTQEPGGLGRSSSQEHIKRRGPWERDYVSGILRTCLSEREVSAVFRPLCDVVGDDLDVDLDLLNIRCAVIAAATELGEQAEPLDRLINPGSRLPSAPKAQRREAALAVRWLIDRKATLIADAVRGVTGVFDRLAVTGLVTPQMFGELMLDLRLGAKRIEELYDWLSGDWLRGDEFRELRAGVLVSDRGGTRLGKMVSDAALAWLGDDEQSGAYQNAQIAAERCYRACLVMDRAHVPAPGYADLVAPGYGGQHLLEIEEWWKNLYAWAGHVAEIASADHRKDAGIAITCLFLETWWWWGDQLRLRYVDDVLDVARKILRDQPEWISALDEFDKNYVPELDLRAGAGDRWRHVAHALEFISGSLHLRQGDVPADDPVLARIYVCWCFFSGDVAQQTGDLEAADRWFREAAEACADDEDNAGMRAFASYQRADVWIPSDTDRSMRVIRETGVADAAVALGDLSLSAYVARMYGDIRWESGDMGGAFDAYGRALLLTYVYQVDQETEEQAPSEYSSVLYKEMRTRFLRRLGEAHEIGRASEADAAIARIRKLFGPYWELKRAATVTGEDPLVGVVPPLPDQAVLNTFDSGYAKDALLMLNDKLQDEVAEPVDQRLQEPEE
jgi:hypothetical protein